MFDKFKLVFWDFDGVIKDSVPVKTKAYLDLFPSATSDSRQKIQDHHHRYGGISRLKKIPLYMEWVGLPVDEASIQDYTKKFASLVVDAVVNSPWISGVQEILNYKKADQYYVVVTGTPQDEIERILEELKLLSRFDFVYGAPTEKKDAIKFVLDKTKISPADSLMIGDSQSDWESAVSTNVNFVLRSDDLDLFSQNFKGFKIRDFREFI